MSRKGKSSDETQRAMGQQSEETGRHLGELDELSLESSITLIRNERGLMYVAMALVISAVIRGVLSK